MMKDGTTQLAPRPASPSPGDRSNKGIQPYELDSELAQLKIVETAINKMPPMAIITKPFIVRQGIFSALNHRLPIYRLMGANETPFTTTGKNFTQIGDKWYECIAPGNPTGYDSRLRLAVYDHVSHHSVNNEGEYFHSFWAFAMKPKMIIQGMTPMGQMQEDEGRQSIFDRIRGWFGKGDKKE